MTRQRISLNIETLSELLMIDPSSPSGLTWKKGPSTFSSVKVGSTAGSIGSEGYYKTKINGVTILNHRIVWALVNNLDPGSSQIDHIDRNRLNNKPSNLRLATHRGNSQNRVNRSRYGLGVKKHGSSFQARIRVDGRLIHLGSFPTAEEAEQAYKRAVDSLPLPAAEVE